MNGHVSCFNQLEKKIKNAKSQKLILMESKGNEEFGRNKVLSPRLYYSNGRLSVIFETHKLMEFDSFIDGLVYLYGIYFCFDLEYQDAYKQALGFFQQFLFQTFRNAEVARTVGFVNVSSLFE